MNVYTKLEDKEIADAVGALPKPPKPKNRDTKMSTKNPTTAEIS